MLSTERRAYARAWYAKNKDKYADYRLKQFGLTLESYEELFAKQNGACAICRSTDAKGPRGTSRLAVDHDHVTGKIRGLLCSSCNRLLGRIESPKGQAALTYLQEAK